MIKGSVKTQFSLKIVFGFSFIIYLSPLKQRLGVVRRRPPQFLVQKASDFSKFMVCPYGQGG